MPSEATYEIVSADKIRAALDKGQFIVPVGVNTLTSLANSRQTATAIINAVRTFDRANSNRGDWEAILALIVKNREDRAALLAMF